MDHLSRRAVLGGMGTAAAMAVAAPAHAQERTLLNVSYDPTREFYRDVNTAFAATRREKNKETVRIRMSHGGSGRQARAVIDGLEADVVTLALGYDIDVLAEAGHVARNWREALPARAAT
jgi:sulfate/thiosulfate transport system substrate-binding protein